MTPPIVYNLFPRLVGPLPRWAEHARRAREMDFNWLFVNPWHYPGFSGSLYAPKEFRRLNPLFLPEGAPEEGLEPLADFLGEMRDLGMPVMMDLVVNHTSKDAPLIEEHPDWYVRDATGQVVSPFVRDPDDPTRVTVWGDLAEIDNAGSRDREALWSFWAALVRDSLALGFRGFRCDAAYKVPAGLWSHLIDVARRVDPEVRFFAETLGANVESVLALREAGFDYFFNSSKWWDFRQPWALEQHERYGAVAPSVAFPETHDTARVAGESGGDEAVQRQRYAFAAAFSAGVMMPIGYEFGFERPVDVVRTVPSDWERPSMDLAGFVRRVNRLKAHHPLLHGEGHLRPVGGLEGDVLLLERATDDRTARGWIVVNKRADAGGEASVRAEMDAARGGAWRLHRVCRDGSPEAGEPVPARIALERAEVALVLPG